MKISVDIREKDSMLVSELVSLGIDIELKYINVADYIIQDIAIERKTISDFISSMINKRLLRQLEEMKQYPKQFLIIEGIGEQELYGDEETIRRGGIHPNAIRGMLLSILLDFKIPIIFTKNYHDSARFIQILINRLNKSKIEFSLKAKKKAYSIREQQQMILEGFPSIGPKTAKKLLSELGSIKKIICAENQDKEKIRKILGKKSEIFFKIIEQEY